MLSLPLLRKQHLLPKKMRPQLLKLIHFNKRSFTNKNHFSIKHESNS
jgi:hypothetical protein